jgi:hypothetical protein
MKRYIRRRTHKAKVRIVFATVNHSSDKEGTLSNIREEVIIFMVLT